MGSALSEPPAQDAATPGSGDEAGVAGKGSSQGRSSPAAPVYSSEGGAYVATSPLATLCPYVASPYRHFID
jgi:hypothetical protein